MTREEHVAKAEEFARLAQRPAGDRSWSAVMAQLAQVHATLALAAPAATSEFYSDDEDETVEDAITAVANGIDSIRWIGRDGAHVAAVVTIDSVLAYRRGRDRRDGHPAVLPVSPGAAAGENRQVR
jgi:hypothetical protein